MTIKPWTVALICFCVLLLGIFLGRRLTPGGSDPDSHKNIITVDVENGSSKINLAPAKNDVIKWVDQANRPVAVKFLTDSPCQEIKKPSDTTDTCTVDVVGGNFQYVCTGSSTCIDPGVDPRSNSGLLASPGGPLPPSPAGSVNASISCPDPNAPPVVIWSPEPPGASVNVGQNIIWKAGSLHFTVTGFNYQNNPITLCSQSTIDQSPGHNTCTVAQDGSHTPPYAVTYTVTTSGEKSCGSASPTLTVSPASPTLTSVPRG